eukprot:TCONS_00059742-protein
MSIKTVVTYSCMIFSIIILIISLATNYWHEYEIPDGKTPLTVTYFNVGLFEKCTEIHYRWGWRNTTVEDLGCEDYEPPLSLDDWEMRRDTLVVMFVLAVIFTLISFIFITVYCATGKYYFPVGRTAICFILAAICVMIGLIVYTNTFINHDVAFSWSYGAGWSAVAMYIITTILIYADK